MNIEALRETQKSIANLSLPFDMDDWCTCIAGHAIGRVGIPTFGVEGDARVRLSLSYAQTERLFMFQCNRAGAIAALEELIQEELSRSNEGAPVLSRSVPDGTYSSEAVAPAEVEEAELVGV